MAFNHKQYNANFIRNLSSTGRVTAPEPKYGVRIVEADVAPGETYWKVIGVHHLLPEENFSKHNIFIEALDEQGNRVKNPIPWAGWTWEGRRPNERADPIPLDKPDSEAAGNISIHFGQKAAVWIKGLNRDANDKSDRVENLHTAHPDEPLPDGRLLNTLGHHSFYVVFQRTRKQTQAAPSGVISGRVEHGQGRRVRLLQGNQVVAEQDVDSSLNFRFANLPLGVYRLEIVGTTVSQDNLSLTSTNNALTLNLTIPGPITPPPPPPPATKSIAYYLLFGPPNSRGRQTNLLLALNYILTFSPTVGFSVEEAKQARQVTIIGEGVSSADQQAIRNAGSQVEVLAGDPYEIEARLNARIRAGRAFGG